MFEALIPDSAGQRIPDHPIRCPGSRVGRAVDGLPQGYRTVLLMDDVGGFTHAEIGEVLGYLVKGTSSS